MATRGKLGARSFFGLGSLGIMMERKTYSLPDGLISYLHWSSEKKIKPTLLFLHATGFNSQTYQSILAPLHDRFEIYAVDLRGHGFSQLPNTLEKFISWSVYEEDVSKFLQGLPGPVFMAGHSLGAIVALGVTNKNPKLVEGIVLFEPVILEPYINFLWGLIRQIKLGNWHPLARQAKKRRKCWDSQEQIFRQYRGRGAFKTWPDQILQDYIEGGTCKDERGEQWSLCCDPGWEARSFALTGTSTWSYFKAISCPVKIVYGSKSSTFRPASATYMRSQYPLCQLKAYEDASHFLPMELPQVFQEELLELII